MGIMSPSGKISLGRSDTFTAGEHDTRSIAHVHGSHYTGSNDNPGAKDDQVDVSLGAFRRNHPVYQDHVHSSQTDIPTFSDGQIKFSDFFSTTGGTNTRWNSSDVYLATTSNFMNRTAQDLTYGDHVVVSSQLRCTWQLTYNRLKVDLYDHKKVDGTNSYLLRHTYYFDMTGGLDRTANKRFESIQQLDCRFKFNNCYLNCYAQITVSGTAVFSAEYRADSSDLETGTSSFYSVASNTVLNPMTVNTSYCTVSNGNPTNNSTFGWGLRCSANAGSPQSQDNIKIVNLTANAYGYIDMEFRMYSERRFSTIKIRKNRGSSTNPYLYANSTDQGFSGGKG